MNHSVSLWISGLKKNDADAVQRLWERYATRLTTLADERLGNAPRRVIDEEDIAACVFQSLCRGAKAGRLADVTTRDDLWWLLLSITKQKVTDYVRGETAQKRGGGEVLIESDIGDNSEQATFQFDQLIAEDPTPELIVMLAEQHRRLVGLLPERILQVIVQLRLEGFTVDEIVGELAISKRAVERKLRLIRSIWSSELQHA